MGATTTDELMDNVGGGVNFDVLKPNFSPLWLGLHLGSEKTSKIAIYREISLFLRICREISLFLKRSEALIVVFFWVPKANQEALCLKWNVLSCTIDQLTPAAEHCGIAHYEHYYGRRRGKHRIQE